MAKSCFVICTIGDPKSASRRRSDGILHQIIEPALGHPDEYLVERADHDKTPGIVTESIINKILDSDLVVAELTDLNPNVMYELGVRHTVGKPVVQMMEIGEKLPFDVGGQHTVFYECDLAGRDDAIRDLKSAANMAEQVESLGNPVKRTVDIRNLQGTGQSDTQLLFQELQEIKAQLSTAAKSQYPRVEGWPPTIVLERYMDEVCPELLSELMNNESLRSQGIQITSLEAFGRDKIRISFSTDDGEFTNSTAKVRDVREHLARGNLRSAAVDQIESRIESLRYARESRKE